MRLWHHEQLFNACLGKVDPPYNGRDGTATRRWWDANSYSILVYIEYLTEPSNKNLKII